MANPLGFIAPTAVVCTEIISAASYVKWWVCTHLSALLLVALCAGHACGVHCTVEVSKPLLEAQQTACLCCTHSTPYGVVVVLKGLPLMLSPTVKEWGVNIRWAIAPAPAVLQT